MKMTFSMSSTFSGQLQTHMPESLLFMVGHKLGFWNSPCARKMFISSSCEFVLHLSNSYLEALLILASMIEKDTWEILPMFRIIVMDNIIEILAYTLSHILCIHCPRTNSKLNITVCIQMKKSKIQTTYYFCLFLDAFPWNNDLF